jgi:hypothetical protein
MSARVSAVGIITSDLTDFHKTWYECTVIEDHLICVLFSFYHPQ